MRVGRGVACRVGDGWRCAWVGGVWRCGTWVACGCVGCGGAEVCPILWYKASTYKKEEQYEGWYEHVVGAVEA